MKKIIYLVQRFRPNKEATSKEVHVLFSYFRRKSKIHDLHLDGIFKFKFSRKIISYHFIFYPLFLFLVYLFTFKKIIHVYTGLTDLPYLPFLRKKNMIVTSTNYFSRLSIKKRLQYLRKVKKIIIESEIQKKELIASGIKENKIELIYPPVDLERFNYENAKGKFKILNASCPAKIKDLRKRGIFLLFDADQYLKNIEVNLLWRNGEYPLLKKRIGNRKFQAIEVRNGIIKDMNKEFGRSHCTIIPYIKLDGYLKLIPNSAIESLAAGKPVLVCSQTGIADIIKKEGCGVVFEPNVGSLLRAIKEMKKNYSKYQKNCRKTAEKYFSQDLFIKKYEEIYNGI